jgi:hypothetical protein
LYRVNENNSQEKNAGAVEHFDDACRPLQRLAGAIFIVGAPDFAIAISEHA